MQYEMHSAHRYVIFGEEMKTKSQQCFFFEIRE